MTRAIPDLLLERYRLNELPDAVRATIEPDAAGDPDVRARLDALARSDAEIRARYAPEVLARRAVRRPARRPALRGLTLAATLATAVVALVVAIPHSIVPADGTRIKGAGRPALVVYRRTLSGSERLADGDLARAGDLLRIGYASAGRAYGMILSIDGTGAVTVHLPPAGETAAPLEGGGIRLLDSAYELDDAPRLERFYFITGIRPFGVGPVLNDARHAAAPPAVLRVPSGLEQATFSIQKEVRR